MADVTIEIDLSKIEDKLGERLDEMIQRLDDLSPVLKPSAQYLEQEIFQAFDTSVSPLGESFAPLKDETIKRKGSRQILVDTEGFRRASHAKGDKQSIKFGVSGEAATRGKAHTLGSGSLPRRSVFPIDAGGQVSFSAGRAKTWWERTSDRILDFVLHGKVKRGG